MIQKLRKNIWEEEIAAILKEHGFHMTIAIWIEYEYKKCIICGVFTVFWTRRSFLHSFFKKRQLSSDDDQRVPLEVQCLAVVVCVTCSTTLQLVAVNANSEYLPTHDLAFNADELQFLIACVGLDFFADMATSTNLYAAHSGAGTSWYDTNEREMRCFFGIQIMMGIKQQPEY